MADTIERLVEQRESTHGDFSKSSTFIQDVKELMRQSPNWDKMTDAQRQVLEMDIHKTGRILYGEHSFKDHWLDKQGYVQLIIDEIDYKHRANLASVASVEDEANL